MELLIYNLLSRGYKMAEEQKKTEKKLTNNGLGTPVMEILANKVSRKAVIVAIAMILIYLLAVTPATVATTSTTLFTVAIGGLAVFFTLLQWIIDYRNDDKDIGRRKHLKESKEDCKDEE